MNLITFWVLGLWNGIFYDFVVYRSRIQGPPHCPSSSFINRCLSSRCPHCLSIVPLEVPKETLVLENKEAGDSPYCSDFELVGEDVKWLPNLGIFQKMRLHFMSSLDLNHQLTTFLHILFKEKHVENYNVFSSLADIKRMLHNICFHIDNFDSRLAQVESFFVSDYVLGDLTNPPTNNVQTLALNFSNNE